MLASGELFEGIFEQMDTEALHAVRDAAKWAMEQPTPPIESLQEGILI